MPISVKRGFVLGLALFAGSSLIGCSTTSTSSGGGGNNNPQPSAVITVASSSMNAGASQAVSATVSNPSSSFSCAQFAITSGTLSSLTLNSNTNTCSATYNAPSSVASATTVTFSFSGGGAVAPNVNVTVNPVVAQSVSWNQSAFTTTMYNNIVVNSSVLTASSSCPASAVNVTVTPTTTDTTHAPNSVLASLLPDNTGSTFGTISTGNSIPEDLSNTYKLVATCGTSSSTATLTVLIPAPTLASVSPATVKYGTSQTFTFTGTNFVAFSATQNLNQYLGTQVVVHSGACPTTLPVGFNGVTWISSTSVSVFSTVANNTGSYYWALLNESSVAGTDGGWVCLGNGLVVTNVITGVGSSMIASTTPGSTTTPGALHLTSSTGQQQDYTVGRLAGAPVYSAATQTVYVPNMADHTVSALKLSDRTMSTIAMGDFAPVMLTVSPNDGSVYAYAQTAANAKLGAAFQLLPNDTARLVRTGVNQATSFIAQGSGQLLWTASNTGELHVYDQNSAQEQVLHLSHPAESLNLLPDGTILAYNTGDKLITALDPWIYEEEGSTEVVSGIWGMSGDYAWLADGSIGSLTSTLTQGTRSASLSPVWSKIGSVADPSVLYSGAAFQSDATGMVHAYMVGPSATSSGTQRAGTLVQQTLNPSAIR